MTTLEADSRDDLTARTKEVGIKAQTELLVDKDFSAIDRYWGEPYLQHNPFLENGLVALRAFKEANVPRATTEIIRVFADRDLVFYHQRVSGFMPTPLVFYDLYRMEDGRIVEHWDCWQDEQAPNPSGRLMLDGATLVEDHAATEANRAHVAALIETVYVGGRIDRLDEFLHEDLIQHNPRVGDGVAALMTFLEAERLSGRAIVYDELRRMVVEGNFAMTASKGRIGEVPHAFYDIWRLEGGVVVEHWDVAQAIPPVTKSGLPTI